MCVICEDGKEGLCYLHQKYKDRLAVPYVESVYDFAYFLETQAKLWKKYFKIKIEPNAPARVLSFIRNSAGDFMELRKEIRKLIKDKKKKEEADARQSFDSLIRRLASRFASAYRVPYKELYQEGWYRLMLIDTRKILDKEHKIKVAKEIYAVINNRLLDMAMNEKTGGLIKKYSGAIMTEIMNNPIMEKYNDDFVYDSPANYSAFNTETVEDSYIRREEEHILDMAIKKLRPELTKRKVFVLENLILSEDETQRSAAEKLKVDQSTISRDKEFIENRLRDIINNGT